MGMQVSEVNGQICFALDIGSIFSNYISYIPSVNNTSLTTPEDIN
jgi:hypothetical protein